jgi:hypothetical protein
MLRKYILKESVSRKSSVGKEIYYRHSRFPTGEYKVVEGPSEEYSVEFDENPHRGWHHITLSGDLIFVEADDESAEVYTTPCNNKTELFRWLKNTVYPMVLNSIAKEVDENSGMPFKDLVSVRILAQNNPSKPCKDFEMDEVDDDGISFEVQINSSIDLPHIYLTMKELESGPDTFAKAVLDYYGELDYDKDSSAGVALVNYSEI